MALYKLLLPKMGESVAEATVIKWNKAIGDQINIDDVVIEIATDKVDSEVPSPVSGKLVEQLFQENDTVQVGSVIAVIDTSEISTPNHRQEIATPEPVKKADEPAAAPILPAAAPFEKADSIPGVEQLRDRPAPVAASSVSNSNRFYSPLVKNIANQENVSARELDTIPGTGAEGRLTKEDLLAYIKHRSTNPQAVADASAAHSSDTNLTPATPKPAPRVVSLNAGDEIIEMDRMRRLIADHMVMSTRVSPHVTSFVEADVTNLVQWREKVKASFEQHEGTKITFTPIFIEAVARAIKDMPMINVSVNGTQIIKRKDINIGMATALPSGNLIVPVIRKADELNLVGLSKAVNGLSARARVGKLSPDDVKDGTFTVTNVGTFGNVMGTPIINQPQVAILALGAIKKQPAVIETLEGDIIAIRHMMYLSLSYDHRVVDGALGGSFVRRVADYLEAWDVNRER